MDVMFKYLDFCFGYLDDILVLAAPLPNTTNTFESCSPNSRITATF
jgi:hypothetical protein